MRLLHVTDGYGDHKYYIGRRRCRRDRWHDAFDAANRTDRISCSLTTRRNSAWYHSCQPAADPSRRIVGVHMNPPDPESDAPNCRSPQPIIAGEDGLPRFQENRIVVHLLKHGRLGRGDFARIGATAAEREQLEQPHGGKAPVGSPPRRPSAACRSSRRSTSTAPAAAGSARTGS